MRLGFWGRENPKGGAPLAWGASLPSLAAAPPRRSHLLGQAPPLGGYIKGGGERGLITHCPGASLSLSNTSSSSVVHGEALPEYCSSTITTPSCCCWSLLPQPLLCLAGSRRRRHYADRTCVERGGAVLSVLGSPVIWITVCTTTSSPFVERFRSQSTKWYVDAISLSHDSLLDELIDGSW